MRAWLDEWEFSKSCADGESRTEIARKYGKTRHAVEHRARQLGFNERACPYDFDQPFDSKAMRSLIDRIGVSSRELERIADLPKDHLQSVTKPHLAAQRAWPKSAKKLLDFCDECTKASLKIDFAHQSPRSPLYRSSERSVLLTWKLNLPNIARLIVSVLEQLSLFLRKNSTAANLEHAKQYICEQARREVKEHSREKIFVRFLRCARKFEGLLESALPQLRSPGRVGFNRLAYEWLASLYYTSDHDISGKTKWYIVKQALNGRTRALPWRTMRAVFEASMKLTVAPPKSERKKRRGGQRGMRKESIRTADHLLEEMEKFIARTGKKRGALSAAVRIVFPGQDTYSSMQRAHRLLSRFKRLEFRK